VAARGDAAAAEVTRPAAGAGWTGLRFELGGTTLLVSRGAADTLPARFRCPREVLLCELGGA
jgi:predicted MPP superfamily phosphohydrolase